MANRATSHEGDESRRGHDPESDAAFEQSVYAHLRAIAQSQMNSERPGHTLSATALVHEAFLRLGGAGIDASRGRSAFLHAAAEAMRRILIEHARSRGRLKRGGKAARVSLESIGDVADLATADDHRAETVFAFDDAFRRLEAHEPRAADVVRLRFYAGLSIPEVAAALGISDRTVNNCWAYARAWLAREIERELGPDGESRSETQRL